MASDTVSGNLMSRQHLPHCVHLKCKSMPAIPLKGNRDYVSRSQRSHCSGVAEPPTDVRRNYAFTSMREPVLLPAALLIGAPLRAATAAASLLSSVWA